MSCTASKPLAQPEPRQHAAGIRRVGIGEDDLAPGQPRDGGRKRSVFLQRVHLDIMDVFQECVRIDLMFGHQPGKRGTVAVEIALLDAACLVPVDLESFGDIAGHPRIDLIEQSRARRIQRVVEIEYPVADRGKTREHMRAALRRALGRGKAHTP